MARIKRIFYEEKKYVLFPIHLGRRHLFWSLDIKTLSVLIFALSILGIGDGLIVLSNLGSTPWTVLSQGIAIQTNMSIGWASFFYQLYRNDSLVSTKTSIRIGHST